MRAQDIKHLNVLKEGDETMLDHHDGKNTFEDVHLGQVTCAVVHLSQSLEHDMSGTH